MNKKTIAIIVLSILLVLIILTYPTERLIENKGEQIDISPNTKSYQLVEKFQGSQDKTTEEFYISGEKFKIVYKVEPEPEWIDYSIFFISIYEGKQLVGVNELVGTGETLFYGNPGYYHLDMGSASIKNWEIEVYDYK